MEIPVRRNEFNLHLQGQIHEYFYLIIKLLSKAFLYEEKRA